MKAKQLAALVVISSIALVGCAGSGSGNHHHSHKHQYQTKDSGYKTYKRSSKANHHHTYKHHNYYYRNYYGERVYYPYSYYGNKHAAHVRMSQKNVYGQGYENGCRTAWTGGMYKNAKLLSNSQSYQMGWEAGFNQCHYDRTHINAEKPKYSYIPY